MSQTPTPLGPLNYELPERRFRAPSPREIFAWLIIIAATATMMAATMYRYRHSPAVAADQPSESRITQLTLVAKYSVGARDFMRAASSGQADQQLQQMVKQMNDVAQAPTEQLRVAMTTGEMADGKAALERIALIEPTVKSDEVRQDIAAMKAIYSAGPDSLDAAQGPRLVRRYGWFGHLALGFTPGANAPDNADRQIALASAHRVVIGVVIAIVVGGILFLAGFVLMIVLLVLVLDGKLVRRFVPVQSHSVPFLEAFAIYLGAYLVISLIARFVAPRLLEHLAVLEVIMLVPPALGILWPRLCGATVTQWRQALGWHAGRGMFKEIGFGITGYIAGLPFLALMFLISTVLIKWAGAQPDHPVVHQLTGSRSLLAEVFVLACIYAPLVEETMFRGAFFNYMRSSHGWLVSAAVTSLIFAAIHPQGWTLIPVLGGIAMILAAIREWRGTIFASAAAHALNNGTVLLLAITLLR